MTGGPLSGNPGIIEISTDGPEIRHGDPAGSISTMMRLTLVSLTLCFLLRAECDAEDLLIADFEQPNFGGWEVSGEAFGQGSVKSYFNNHPLVKGEEGNSFVSSIHGGEGSKGALTSPEFVIGRDYINFLAGGGYNIGNRQKAAPVDFWGDELSVSLLVKPTGLPLSFNHIHTGHHRLAVRDKLVLRNSTGPGIGDAGIIRMRWDSWDVRSLQGVTAQIRIVDNNTGPEGFICVDHIVQADQPKADLLHNWDILRRANENVMKAEKNAPSRRGYHYRPPKFGFGGPTCVYHNGYYHMFYIYNPFHDRNDKWNHNFWRHARSRDLVSWEDMSVVIWPSEDNGEFYCASGAAIVDHNDVPRIFYTSRSSERAMDQMSAVGNADLTNWRKVPSNPVVVNTPDNPMAGPIGGTGTDCGLFRHEDRWYMVLGGSLKMGDRRKGCFTLHASEDLVNWEFVGVPYVAETKGWEEPEMFRLGDKWVVIFEPFGPTQYYTGTFDWDNIRFHPEVHSFVDFVGSEKHDSRTHGHAQYAGQFYGCTPFKDKDGRMIYMGMAPGGSSIPRVLSLRPDGKLAQKPVEALAKLRGEHYSISNIELVDASYLIHGIGGDMLEIKVEFIPGSSQNFGINVRRTDDGGKLMPIRYDGQRLVVENERIPADLMEGESSLRLHILIDQHIMEIFANDWVVYTKALPGSWGSGIELFSRDGDATVKKLDIWKMSSLW
jgi:beta-fructofuranosidase